MGLALDPRVNRPMLLADHSSLSLAAKGNLLCRLLLSERV
jgi:hypothetical protein